MVGGGRGIVFIHGMYVNGISWDPWLRLATDRGYTAHAPSWPCHEGEPAYLREYLDPALGRLTFGEVVTHLVAMIRGLPARPVLVGHSIGGLLVQRLVAMGLARAGVAISPAPPQGIFSLDPNFLRANLPHINPLAGNRPVFMNRARFHYAFANTLDRAASDAAFDAYVVPESRNVPRSTLGAAAKIDFTAPHVPLFFIAGDRDHLTPMPMVQRNMRAYGAAGGVVDYRGFTGRSHFICNEPGWQEVAAAALDWIDTRVPSG